MAEPLFREIEHTADIGIEVEADTADELFRRAGLALFSLMVGLEGVEAREEREEMVQAEGWEDLLHDWLSRLLHNFLQDGFIVAQIKIDELDATHIRARLAGEKLDYERHNFETEIKAVTYHQLSVTCENGRWLARVIFDV
ncbi:MAG TPA: archease [Candidatus Binatia bacterium]|jgi:SHS2 domain-containing protein|nr:archease [Candidatus Binatia bacterium]